MRVASCGLRSISVLRYAVGRILAENATRNFYGYVFFVVCICSILIYLYILLYVYIYLYIIYNIIKNKKKNPPIGLHIYTLKNRYTTKVAGCVFGENRPYSILWLGFWAQPATCNLATRLRFCSRFLVHICVMSSSSSTMFLAICLLLLMFFAIFACVNILTLKDLFHGIL